MFWNKQKRKINDLILSDEDNYGDDKDDGSVINVKISSKDQLFSSYSYSGDKLNPEFSDYIFEKAKSIPIKDGIKIKIHTAENIDAGEVNQTIKSHCRQTYKESKKEIKRISAISLIMTLLGIIALTALILINHFTDNLYVTSIVEIAAWVFIWEAVDYFFLQRPVIKGKCLLIQKIYTAETEICKAEKTD